MIGIVVVSHSRALGQAAVDLARDMVEADSCPTIAVAAGLDDTTFGTDAAAVSEALIEVDSPEGTLVLMDLGSALLSSEMALEFVDPDLAARVLLSAAPLIEGLVSAVVTASSGASLSEVGREASNGLAAKREQLGIADPDDDVADTAGSPSGEPDLRHELTNPHGLHARPAAKLVSALRGLDASVHVANETTGSAAADASSLSSLASLGLRQGHTMVVHASGPDADTAIQRITVLAADGFGDAPDPAGEALPDQSAEPIRTRLRRLVTEPDLSGYEATDGASEEGRLDEAIDQVAAHLESLKRAVADPGIFEAQLALLRDASFTGAARNLIGPGNNALESVTTSGRKVVAQFESMSDAYLAERAQDLRQLQRQLSAALVGADLTLPGGVEGLVVIDELDADVAAQLPDTIAGVITLAPVRTGHGIIIARSRGIPVIHPAGDISQLNDGDEVIAHPDSGEIERI